MTLGSQFWVLEGNNRATTTGFAQLGADPTGLIIEDGEHPSNGTIRVLCLRAETNRPT